MRLSVFYSEDKKDRRGSTEVITAKDQWKIEEYSKTLQKYMEACLTKGFDLKIELEATTAAEYVS